MFNSVCSLLRTMNSCLYGRQANESEELKKEAESIKKTKKIAERLLHSNGDPLYGQPFALVDGKYCFLAKKKTDMQGRLSFDADPDQYAKLSLVRLEDPEQPEKSIAEAIRKGKTDIIELSSPFKPSENGLKFSYLKFNKYRLPEDPSQIPTSRDTLSDIYSLLEDVVPFVKEQVVNLQDKLTQEVTTEEVQKIFDFGKEKVPLKHDNDTLVKMIMEWWVPNLQTEKDGLVSFELAWDDYRNKDSKNSKHDLPNLKVYMKPREDGMDITTIIVQYPGEQPVSCQPAKKSELLDEKKDPFVNALKTLANGVLLAAELKHLIETHFGMGFYTQLITKYLPNGHPIREFINPLIQDNLSINEKGEKILLTPDGFFGGTAISDNILDLCVEDLRSKYDYFSRPAQPLFKGDDYAVKANAIFERALKVCTKKIEEKWEEIKKPENWAAVFYLCKNAVEESFPYQPQDLSTFVDPSPIEANFTGIKKLDRIKGEDGKLRTVRPIIEGDITGPKEGDKERLILWLAHLFNLNYAHHNLHTLQNPYAADLGFALLSDGNTQNAKKQPFTIEVLTNDRANKERVLVNNYPGFEDQEISEIFQEAHGKVEETMEGIFI